MSESSLSLSYSDLRSEIGQVLGFGRDATLWDTDSTAIVLSVLKSGLRQFYFPPAGGGGDFQIWSFLQPVMTLKTTSGVRDYDLPDDFGGLRGPPTFYGDSQATFALTLTGEGMIRAFHARDGDSASGRPTHIAIRPKATDGVSGQRFQACFYPEPDSTVYTVQIAYTILPDVLSTTNLYPYGGVAHAETILASCLAVAERRIDGEEGVRTKEFFEKLAASMALDVRLTRADNLGYNGDGSDSSRSSRHSDTHETTYLSTRYP